MSVKPFLGYLETKMVEEMSEELKKLNKSDDYPNLAQVTMMAVRRMHHDMQGGKINGCSECETRFNALKEENKQ